MNAASTAPEATQVMQSMKALLDIPDEAIGLDKYIVAGRARKLKRFELLDAVMQIQESEGFVDDEDKVETMHTACRFQSRTAVFLAYLVADKSFICQP